MTSNHSGLIVLTGGSASGKTTLVEHFAGRGYRVVPEAAIGIIEELNQKFGVAKQREWRVAHPLEFQRMVLERQFAQEERAAQEGQGDVFLDRACYDSIAYLELRGHTVAAGEVRKECTNFPIVYKAVFLLETLDQFVPRTQTGRTSTYEDSVRTGEILEVVYRSAGYPVVRIPVMDTEKEANTEKRASFILSRLQDR